MTLSRKIVFVIVLTFIALVGIIAATSDIILLNNFRQIEKQSILAHTRQIFNLIMDREELIDVTARDFSSAQDELIRNGLSPGDADLRYLGQKNLKSHRLDMGALYDDAGCLRYIRAINCDSATYCDIGPEKQQALDAMVASLKLDVDTHFKGTVNVAGVPLMVSLQAQKAANGTLRGIAVIGCFLDRNEIDHISRLTGYTVTVTGLDSGRLASDAAGANAELQQGKEVVARVLNDDRVAGYFYLKDIFGKPSFIVNIVEKRTLIDQGKVILNYIVAAMVVSGGVLCGVMLIFMRGAVLKRLANFSATVEGISKKRDISARLEVWGEDELEGLAVSVNMMLESLDIAEQSLKESELRYRTLFERAPDAIFIIGTEGKEAGCIVDANRAACELHGYPLEVLQTMRINDLNTPETNAVSAEIMRSVLRGEWVNCEVWHLRKDGTSFPVEIHAGRITLGGRSYVMGFDRDITSRKLAEETDRMYLEQIRQLNTELGYKASELAGANKELESFNYSISHDMRGPLTRISGYCQLMLEDDDALDPQIRTYLSRIYESCCWLDEMLDAMLKLSRLANTDFIPDKVDLSAIVESAVRDLTESEPNRVIDVVIAPGVMVVGDARLLKILMSNLISNAWKYSATSIRSCMEFGVMANESHPVYFIRDNGVGFDMKDADKLFRVFTRLHDPTQFSGYGIGLATVQRVIARHGGRVWAEGEVGRGATFFFTLTPDIQSA